EKLVEKKINKNSDDYFNNIINNHYYNLIKFLLIQGYIDESYFDYISYFDKESIHPIDKVFLRRVNNRIISDYNYKLKNPYEIIEDYLSPTDYYLEAVLNFDIIDYLL